MSNNLSEKRAAAGRLGGLATFARYGSEHMATIGRLGARALHERYWLHPWGQSDYVLVRKSDSQFVARISGKPLPGKQS